MRHQRAFIVTVNGIEVARYKGNPGGAYQVTTNHAADIYSEYQERANNGEPEVTDKACERFEYPTQMSEDEELCNLEDISL
ncbi:MAG: hypothetical protein NC095_08235 [Muribaculum sp.]|nr:hypothetical protein [Muribaculum sp.]